MKLRKSFREKLADNKDFPRVEKLVGGMRRLWGDGTIVLPAPCEVNELMRRVPKGRLTTINQIREVLARRHHATIACPIITGIYARIAAGAAGEEAAEGKKRITPYWRTLKADGEVNSKYPGGLEEQRRRLRAEGFTLVARGKRMYIRNYQRFLIRPSG